MYWFRFSTLIVLLAIALLVSCSPMESNLEPRGISIASRGITLDTIVPDPTAEVLPAASVEIPTEQAFVEPVEGECAISGNLQDEVEVVRLVNEIRVEAGLERLSEHAMLTQAARLHSADMACEGFLSHTSPTAGTVVMRVEAVGYNYSAVAENIGMGYATPEEVVEAWMDSLGHRENILGEVFTQIGIGLAQLDDEGQTRYWTIILAAPANP